ncbi:MULTISPECIES: histidine kinase [Prochlorococcus]|uniref:Adaptive-response sensory kinase SasA n=1 Tax=Prochlorococcus marinus (strain SARG / CCMP1375 / SS120) TaxID=167539 RepID=SASA_PROMA|nr:MULTISPECIES: histidine kinase [Prochlorococcus]Q7BWI3.1 RecName: Full=Adaptive-response sensory kinase SasA; AltName: Full=Sensor histidine kinase SasA [Prochlorococcus marinus subsp. marinus str. CCMP1375]CAB61760.1 putative His-kinase [Prochlorococcus marinus]AAQ00166.1 Signal transduction histidine kinase [Prochlorococcus marinus subsp. marinus str. CCMP1375]KGG13964.1 Clock-associated two-component sensor histidine kinase SasA [Prochlorococcus marinus str. LG]KGG19097.1 Clock-associate
MNKATANERKKLRLLLVASRKHLSRGDLRSLIRFLESEDCGFEIKLQFSDPKEQPELLELHRLVAIPALIKLDPQPKQIFAGTSILEQLKNWLPRWEQEDILISSGLGINLRQKESENGRTRNELLLEDENLVLRQENETLSNQIESQERLLRMVAHELRTPLSAAKLALQSQALGQIDLIKLQEVVKRRLEEIESLSKDLLEVGTTRWEALFNPQEANLANIAAEVILELEKFWLSRGIGINTDIPADLPNVFADQSRMKQVLLNLIENALKFSNDGDTVEITMLHRTNQWVQISVSDKGPGIPEEEQQRIFLDRVRLPQTSNETSGFGIGLSVCRRIVEVHGGKIWVVSQPGEGSCFYFTVPVWDKRNKSLEPLTLTQG